MGFIFLEKTNMVKDRAVVLAKAGRNAGRPSLFKATHSTCGVEHTNFCTNQSPGKHTDFFLLPLLLKITSSFRGGNRWKATRHIDTNHTSPHTQRRASYFFFFLPFADRRIETQPLGAILVNCITSFHTWNQTCACRPHLITATSHSCPRQAD